MGRLHGAPNRAPCVTCRGVGDTRGDTREDPAVGVLTSAGSTRPTPRASTGGNVLVPCGNSKRDEQGLSSNQDGTGGTLTVTDGTHTANIALVGQYAAEGFAIGADNGLGTLLSYNPDLLQH